MFSLRHLTIATGIVAAGAIIGAVATYSPRQTQTVVTVATDALDCVPPAIVRLTACHQARDVSCAVGAVASFVICVAAHQPARQPAQDARPAG